MPQKSNFDTLNSLNPQSSEYESEQNEGEEEEYGFGNHEETGNVRKNSTEDIAHIPSETDYNYFSPSFQCNLNGDRTLIDRNVRNYAHYAENTFD